MRIPELQRLLVEGALAQEEHRVRRRVALRRPLIALAAILVLGGSTAVAVLAPGRSRPLSGTLPAHVFGYPNAGTTHYRISMFPYLSVGWTGWCESVVFSADGHREATSYSCAPVEASDEAVIAWHPGFGDGSAIYSYSILTDSVAAVRYSDGDELSPVGAPQLPSWARAVVRVYTGRAADTGKRSREQWLGSDGRPLNGPEEMGSVSARRLALRTVNPRSPGGAPCAVHARALSGLAPIFQELSEPVAWPRRAPGGFMACANAVYRLHGTELAVSVLVNALDPRRLADPLPGVAADPARRGVFTGGEMGSIGYPSGSGVWSSDPAVVPFYNATHHRLWNIAEGHNERTHALSAVRAGRAWLVAEGGTAAQRAELLGALHTGV
jgi:hypothetical protein